MTTMNDIEEAIEVTKRQINELKSELKTLETQEYIDSYNLAIKVKELSIEVLKEKVEREKGCEYCNEKKSILSCFTEYSLEISNGEISIWNGLRCEASFLINYCPLCGKKLGETNDT